MSHSVERIQRVAGLGGGDTLHQKIMGDIEGRIRSGEWPPGHRIPFEHELMQAYGCSRMTVSKAVGALAAAGLITRRRRTGSVVALPRFHSAVLKIADIAAEVESRGAAYSFDLLDRVERPAGAAQPAERTLAANGVLLAVQMLHRANGIPFAYERRLISLAAAPEAASIDFQAISPSAWLVAHVPWTEADHRISARAATAEEAARLGLDVGAACLSLERWTWRAGQPITHVTLLFPGESYDLTARFTPASGGGAQ